MRLSFRPAGPADAPAAVELINAFDALYAAEHDPLGEQDVHDWWSDLVDDGATVVTDQAGRIVGLGALRRRDDCLIADNYVRLDMFGNGLGALLAEWAEQRAAQAGVRALRSGTLAADRRAAALLEARGYGYVRSFYRMTADLDEPPEPPRWPTGFAVSTLEPGEERRVHEVLEAAFADHWGYAPRSFEEWSVRARIEVGLTFLVRAAGRVVAAEICNEERFGVGWIGVLGVLPDARRSGVGEALLRHAFCELYARGRRRIGLGVDADNTTGATRLYQRVGMRPTVQEDVYEKVLAEVAAGPPPAQH